MEIFHEMPCLTERSKQLKGTLLQKKWFKSADRRFMAFYLQKFIDYNSKLFQFIGVEPYIIGSDQSIALEFRSSNFIGAIPLRSPDRGAQIGDFIVAPRFTGHNRFEDYIEILDLLRAEISPEITDSIPLCSGANLRPPLYIEAVKFISSLEQLVTKHWQKFDSITVESNQPMGQINWKQYIETEYKVEKRLQYPVLKSVLNELHHEYAEIKYVFQICKAELLSSNTPSRIKNTLRKKISFLDEHLYHHKIKKTKRLTIRSSDTPIVKSCKQQANKILNFNLTDSTAWRIDFSDVFEKYVQYIFKQVSVEIGGRLISNPKLRSTISKHYSWELKHLEPDAIFQRGDTQIFIDAKYKSNLYNKFEESNLLREEHRHDLHQIMAYTSFNKTASKHGFLCYPSNNVEVKSIQYRNETNGVENKIFVLGVPLKKDRIKETKRLLTQQLNDIFEKELP